MEVLCIKTPTGALVPMGDEEAEKLRKVKGGAVVRADIAQMRNGRFFRKFFVLCKFAFDIWAESVPVLEHKGRPVLPEFDRFRRDLTILAGFCRPVFNALGEMRLEAESISWASMDEERFEKLYSATINVILSKILAGKGFSEEQLRTYVDQCMRFDS